MELNIYANKISSIKEEIASTKSVVKTLSQVTNYLLGSLPDKNTNNESKLSDTLIQRHSNNISLMATPIIDGLSIGSFPKFERSLVSSCPNSPKTNTKKISRSRQSKFLSKAIASFGRRENGSTTSNRDEDVRSNIYSECFSMNGEQKFLNDTKNKFPTLKRKELKLSKNLANIVGMRISPGSLNKSPISRHIDLK